LGLMFMRASLANGQFGTEKSPSATGPFDAPMS
jgi:hypothetical protein